MLYLDKLKKKPKKTGKKPVEDRQRQLSDKVGFFFHFVIGKAI